MEVVEDSSSSRRKKSKKEKGSVKDTTEQLKAGNEDVEMDHQSNSEKNTPNTAENDDSAQKLQLMSMFSEQTLLNYQRVPKARDQKINTEQTSDAEEEQEVDPSTQQQTLSSFDPTKDNRTLFVGNLPISMDQKAITKLFSPYGKIESVRFRSIPRAGMKVDKAGDQNLVKKVSAVRHTFGDQKASFNAYVVFEEASSVEAALVENNRVIDQRHIRVDKVTPSIFDPQRTIFIGNLPHRVDEEEVREHFAKAVSQGHDDIESIRIVRDPETLIGKGFGYLLFKSRTCVLDALSLHDKEFKKKWKLRVTLCAKKTKKRTRESSSTSKDENQPPKRMKSKEKEVTMKNALKRINLKTVMTKKKLLESRKKKNSSNNRSKPSKSTHKRK